MTALDYKEIEANMRKKAEDIELVLNWAEGPSPSCDCPDWVDAAIRSMAKEIRLLRRGIDRNDAPGNSRA